jgi:hypothetical protein
VERLSRRWRRRPLGRRSAGWNRWRERARLDDARKSDCRVGPRHRRQALARRGGGQRAIANQRGKKNRKQSSPEDFHDAQSVPLVSGRVSRGGPCFARGLARHLRCRFSWFGQFAPPSTFNFFDELRRLAPARE